MKKSILFFLLFTSVASAQYDFLKFMDKEYGQIQFAFDPVGTFNEGSPNVGVRMELVSYWGYVEGGVTVLPGLEGGYTEFSGGGGFNFSSDNFDTFRYYAGVKLGVVSRGGNPYGIAGVEGGVEWNIDNSGWSLGLRANYDWREDFKFSGADPAMQFSGAVTFSKRLSKRF